MIDYILPMTGNTACVITSDSHPSSDLARINFYIVRTGTDLRGGTLFDYTAYVLSDDCAAWNRVVEILEQVARRVASYRETRPEGLGYLDRAYLYIDDAKPELEKLCS